MAIQQLSPKQKEAFKDSDARINIFEGPVRAGKSFISLIRWIDFCINGPKGDFVVVGRSLGALKRNFIAPMMMLLGSDFIYFEGKREATIYGRNMYVIGANDERATGKIQGATFAGAWIDEGTLIPETFFKMLLSRLSIPNAKMFVTTNPDSPFHWLKTDYIDREGMLDMKVFKFTIDDNPSLTESYKESLKKEYSGLWFDRYILGKWCLAEDAVFDFFNEEFHVIKNPPTYAKYYIVGVDYGTTNPFAATLIGYNGESHPCLWVEKEFYYDSKVQGHQKTDSEYADMLQRWMEGYNIRAIYIDPSAASFNLELKRRRLQVIEANNDVLDGIRFVSSLFIQGDLKICRECKNLIKEIGGYVWDKDASLKGQDKPAKRSDHAIDGTRYALMTCFGHWDKLHETQPKKPRDPWNQPGFGWRPI